METLCKRNFARGLFIQQIIFLGVLNLKKGDKYIMEIQRINQSPAFSAKFQNNKAFQEVVQHAVNNNCLRTLDCALNTLKKADNCTITIAHGVDNNGVFYSTFLNGRRSVSNSIADAKTPAEASLDGILELSMLSRKFRSLIGTPQPKQNITKESIIKEYTV